MKDETPQIQEAYNQLDHGVVATPTRCQLGVLDDNIKELKTLESWGGKTSEPKGIDWVGP